MDKFWSERKACENTASRIETTVQRYTFPVTIQLSGSIFVMLSFYSFVDDRMDEDLPESERSYVKTEVSKEW